MSRSRCSSSHVPYCSSAVSMSTAAVATVATRAAVSFAMPAASACQRVIDDGLDDASTAASSEVAAAGIKERLAEFDETDKEQDDSLAQPSAIPEFGRARQRWADLEDSSDEGGNATIVQSSQIGKLAWADLVDSEGEERALSAGASKDAVWTDRRNCCQPAPAAASARQSSRAEPKAKRSGKAALPARDEPASESAPGSRTQPHSQHLAGRHSAAAASRGAKPWSQPWEARGAERWRSKNAAWHRGSANHWDAALTAKSTHCAKPQCQFFIGIEEDSKFKVTRKVLGPHGQHMKVIAEQSGAKLRLRGRGSGFLEGTEKQESTDELMLCVSAPDGAGYAEAVRLVSELLDRVYEDYRAFCRKSGRAVPVLEVRLHEGPRSGSR